MMRQRQVQGERSQGAGRVGGRSNTALTLLELLIVVAILGLLSTIAVVNVRQAQMRAKVTASKSQLRTLADAIEHYRVDTGRYPRPVIDRPAGDPFGIVASSALRGLTTPVAYVTPDAFRDPFGTLRLQLGAGSPGLSAGGFLPPIPNFNSSQSLLYYYYPYFGAMVGKPEMVADGYVAASIGPDLKDSFIPYYPFPDSVPAGAAAFGILSAQDTIYDPTNGTSSGGDLGAFGGSLPVPRLVGGGEP